MILPENTLSARFTTTAGPDLREVQGTVYVGSHPEFNGEERILWFRIEQGPGADGRIYPTVYTLWHVPRLVPLLHTPAFVMGKLFGGADLMTPGLANGPPFPKGAVKGATVAVASLDRPSVPVFVGVCEIDIASLGEVQGAKGHAVRGVHWEGDELWSWSSSSRPGQPGPEALEGWSDDVKDVENAVEGLALEDKDEGGVPVAQASEDQPEPAQEEPEKEPTQKGVLDRFLVRAHIDLSRNRGGLCQGILVRPLSGEEGPPRRTKTRPLTPNTTIRSDIEHHYAVSTNLLAPARTVLPAEED